MHRFDCGLTVDDAQACLCVNSGTCAQANYLDRASSVKAGSNNQFLQVLLAGFYATYALARSLLIVINSVVYTGPTIRTTTYI